MVTYFFFKIFLLEDERPHGEDYPWWLHHDLWPDPDWDNPLPETPQTCGSREADDLYFHGRPRTGYSHLQDSTKALWPTPPILCILIEVIGELYTKRHLQIQSWPDTFRAIWPLSVVRSQWNTTFLFTWIYTFRFKCETKAHQMYFIVCSLYVNTIEVPYILYSNAI